MSSYIVALECRYWDCRKHVDTNLTCKFCEVIHYLIKDGLIIIDQIHFIHRQYNILYTYQLYQVAVPARLGKNALTGINQDNCQICSRCSCHHIAGELFMTWSISHNKLTLFRCKEAVGDVDGYALLSFRSKTIDKQSKINFFPLCSYFSAIGFQLIQLILEDHLTFIEKSSN